MRIKSLIIGTILAASLTVLTLTVTGLIASFRLAELSSVEARVQAAAREVSTLLVLTHDYALHGEPRAAQQWTKHHNILLQILGSNAGKLEPLAPESIEQIRTLGELFNHLIASGADEIGAKKKQRTEILLDQLLSNTQAISDRFYELSLTTAEKREATEQVFRLAGFAIPFLCLIALVIISSLLVTRILRPLEKMRRAVEAVSKGDLTVRSATGIQDELGELSNAFDTMALDLVMQLREEVAERKQIEKYLHKIVENRTAEVRLQNLRNETILATTPDGFFAADAKGQIRNANPAFCAMLGYTEAELLSMKIPDIEANENQADVAARIGKILVEKHDRFDTRHRRKDGSIVEVEISVSLVEVDAEKIFYAFARDISQRKEYETALRLARDEAEHANLAKSEFLSSMSHELRTPMNAILGFGQLMKYDDTLSDDQQENVREILHAGDHLLELINEVLDLARIEAGRIDLSIEPVEICAIVEECLHLMRNLADKHHINISHIDLQGAAVRADRTRLKQALLNLLSNAVKYNREGGSVLLEIKKQGSNRLRILVTDTGKGIPSASMGELFKPFNRFDAEKDLIEGTGIGLTITRRIVEMMGGTIGVESETGVGSTFWIELPLESSYELSRDAVSAASAPLPVSTDNIEHTVLYIEDNPANLRLVAQIIGQRKHTRLLTAHTPGLGIDLAQANNPDLILLDINMPDMDGYQVLKIFKADANLAHIPVVAVTSNAMERDIERGLAAGFDEYITKPLNISTFLAMLDRLLDNSK